MAKGYRTYRGRSHGRALLPILIVILMLLAAIILLFLALQDSIVFTSDGLRFINPFNDKASDTAPSPSPTKKPDFVIVTEKPSPSPSPTQTPAPSSDITLNAVYLPSLSDKAAAAGVIQLADKGAINAVVIDMKHDDGTLGFVSANEYAIKAGANAAAQADISAELKKLKDSGLYLIARVSAFKDNLVPKKVQAISVKVKSGVIWLDRDYHGWLNPYLAEAQDYVSDISSELAGMGFNEILLDNYCFPTLGRPQLLYYGQNEKTSKTDTLNEFAKRLAALLAAKGVTLSINVSPASIINGADQASGQDPASLFAAAGRLFTDIGTDSNSNSAVYTKIQSIASSLSADNINSRFVPVISSPRRYDDPSASENYQVAIGTYVQKDYGWLIRDPAGLYPSSGW